MKIAAANVTSLDGDDEALSVHDDVTIADGGAGASRLNVISRQGKRGEIIMAVSMRAIKVRMEI
jgi:hypothetical protein